MRMFELVSRHLAETLLDELDMDWTLGTLGGAVSIADAETARSDYLDFSAEKIRMLLLTTASATLSEAEEIAKEQVEETLAEADMADDPKSQSAWDMCAVTAGIIGARIAQLSRDILEKK